MLKPALIPTFYETEIGIVAMVSDHAETIYVSVYLATYNDF